MPPKANRPPKKGTKAYDDAKAAKLAKKASKDDLAAAGAEANVFDMEGMKEVMDDGGRVASGNLISEKRARDIKIDSFSLSLHGAPLVEDTVLELNHGSRYGLLGRNGCGKSTFLKCLAAREVPIPDLFDVYLLDHEAPPGEMTALEYVVDSARAEVEKVEAAVEHYLIEEGPESPALMDLYERLDELDPTTFETRASIILVGLGFKPAGASLAEGGSTIDKQTKDMSGGWRMRVALSKALFLQPGILLLDEPTNHLDLEACVWLEEYLATYPKILLVISHSQDFLNGVCTNMMVMQQQQLKYWSGNYDTYLSTKAARDVNQSKMFKKQQEEINHLKEFISSCGTYANLVRQAKSRQKILDKMEDDGLIEAPYEEPKFGFKFEVSIFRMFRAMAVSLCHGYRISYRVD